MGPHCLPLRLLKHFSRREKQTTFVAIGALRVKIEVNQTGYILVSNKSPKVLLYLAEWEGKSYGKM